MLTPEEVQVLEAFRAKRRQQVKQANRARYERSSQRARALQQARTVRRLGG